LNNGINVEEKKKRKLTAGDLKQKIFAAKDTELEKMEISEWQVDIWIKPLTYDERNRALEASSMSVNPDNDTVNAEQIKAFHMAILIAGVRDSEGNAVFSKEDITRLADKSSGVLDRIATRITELSGFGEEVKERVKARFRRR